MSINPLARTIRAKKLGLLIYDARLAGRRNLDECASFMGISPETLEAYENGSQVPSLPELEILAYYLNTPLDHFWSRVSRSETSPDRQIAHPERLISLRQRMLGANLRKLRSDANLTSHEVSERTAIPETDLLAFELGENPIPLTELETIITALGSQINNFIDQRGPVGLWIKQQQAIQKFLELSPELQEFVCTPLNRPYLELAVKLSDLSVEKLRAIAEGLLEITY
jgi:transcriptional regulator with XRE-family HTH domain